MASPNVLHTSPHASPHAIVVSSFAAAVWLLAKGFEPLSAAFNPLRNGVEFLFPSDAKETWAAYYWAKEKLSLIVREARERA